MSVRTVPSRYDRIGLGYARLRRPDRRWNSAIAGALGDARHIVNVGAGTGSYEPVSRTLAAVEPSWVMIRQRRPRSAPVLRATAEHLPIRTASADGAMAVLTLHHWADWRRGIQEMRRIAPLRVIVTFDPERHSDFWLVREYIPAIRDQIQRAPSISSIQRALGGKVSVAPLLVPWDCTDGFLSSYWRRPWVYLDSRAREAISGFALAPPDEVERGLGRLADDLDSGAWEDRHQALRSSLYHDAGFRLVVSASQSDGPKGT